MTTSDNLIIGNCSGFYGDKFSAAREMVQGGPIHVLTGDYLAELTMAILFRKRLRDSKGGFVPTFLRQMEEIMGECLDRGIKVVSNAGGLNPRGAAEALQVLAQQLGLSPRIAYIEGDDLMGHLDELQNQGETFAHLDKGIPLDRIRTPPITANVYLGCWGIVEALAHGADIVIGGRLADASLTVGPAAWHFGWNKDDWDRLAGATVAGHIIECSTQATGGNYPFLDEIPSFKNMGFPIAEVFEDGSCVITKHPGTGGLVSIGTVTAQLLWEIREPHYLTPDVISFFNTVSLTQEGADRVRITGAKGAPPTKTAKVSLNVHGGYRNSMTIFLTGLDIEKKAQIFEETLIDSLGGRDRFSRIDTQLIRVDKPNPDSNEEAWAYFRISVIDPDSEKAGRFFSSKVVEQALATIPGFTSTAPPGTGDPVIIHWPALVSVKHVSQSVHIAEQVIKISPVDPSGIQSWPSIEKFPIAAVPSGKNHSLPLGRVFGARSGDKGGNANLAVWSRTAEAYAFLTQFLTVDCLKALLPDLFSYEIERYELPNVRALNFYIVGLLGDGAASSFRSDPQAKTLGEYLRAKIIEIPERIIPSGGSECYRLL